MTTTARYAVGIDLGTTNSAVAFVDTSLRRRQIVRFDVPQLVAEGRVEARPTLPSAIYLAGEHDVPAGALALPWAEDRREVVGEFARVQGGRVPGRLVTSAKSWLTHAGVDRTARILPWGAPDDVPKLSPVAASARVLGHIHAAWDAAHPDAPLADQQVVLTVPASFDEVARELTVAAAKEAGLGELTLVEEPQAAFYAWLSDHERDWEARLGGERLILVVDVGGGTTDLTLIAAKEVDGRLGLERVAVGEHLLLGGDNMDIALARHVERALGDRAGKLDSVRWQSLILQCRTAKETLLAGAVDAMTVQLAGRGRGVVAGSIAAELTRDDVERIVVDAFFPLVDREARPRAAAGAALREWGLPFASESEIPRHLAAFLARHDATIGGGDAVLYNGAVFTPSVLRDRVTAQLAAWTGAAPAILGSTSFDDAVARGAAYYGLVARGEGIRVGGGSARAFYLGLGPDGDAPSAPAARVGAAAATVAARGGTEVTVTVDDAQRPAAVGVDARLAAAAGGKPRDEGAAIERLLCIVPRGMEEGELVTVREPEFEVLANQPVSFQLYTSTSRSGESPGAIVRAPRRELTALPPIRTVLRYGKRLAARTIPVHLEARRTALGTLEVWCASHASEHRWRLEFQLRESTPLLDEDDGEGASSAELAASPAQLEAAVACIAAVYPPDGAAGGSTAIPTALPRALETALGAGKDAWSLPVIRTLWEALFAGAASRAATADHEMRWLNLCGHLLRPGFGHQLDPWRIRQLATVLANGLAFPRAVQNRVEWWNLHKRIAGGLDRGRQLRLHGEIAPALVPRLARKAKVKTQAAAKAGSQELREMWQAIGACERIDARAKAELGDVIVADVERRRAVPQQLWALARLGAREPVYGPINCVVPAAMVAAWIERLLAIAEWPSADALAFALVQLARVTGDRERDVDVALRDRLSDRLRALPGAARSTVLLHEAVALDRAEQGRLLDETLPVGLRVRSAGASTP